MSETITYSLADFIKDLQTIEHPEDYKILAFTTRGIIDECVGCVANLEHKTILITP